MGANENQEQEVDPVQVALDTRYQGLNDEQVFELGYQRCSKCRHIKLANADFFFPGTRYAHGYRPRCRTCDNEQSRRWNRENKERQEENRRKWVEEHRDENREYQRSRYQEMSEALKTMKSVPVRRRRRKDNTDESPLS